MGFQTCETIDGGKDNWVAVLSWRAAASAGVLMLKITMRLLRSAWLAICCVSCWSAMAETQHIEIYRYTGHSWPPQIEDATLLWRDGCAALIETMCTDSVKALVADIAEANTTLGEPVGFNGDTIRFILHSAAGQERSSYAPDSNSIYMHSSVAAGWNRDFPRKSAVFHEMGHAFFDKHVGSRFCTSCSRGNIEHWGVDEGSPSSSRSSAGGVKPRRQRIPSKASSTSAPPRRSRVRKTALTISAACWPSLMMHWWNNLAAPFRAPTPPVNTSSGTTTSPRSKPCRAARGRPSRTSNIRLGSLSTDIT